MPGPETLVAGGVILAMGIILGALVVRSTLHLETPIDDHIAEADNHRRAEQSRMDEFRREMRWLQRRQPRPERIDGFHGGPGNSPAD